LNQESAAALAPVKLLKVFLGQTMAVDAMINNRSGA
jgi:hypothetical protein